jgi:ABC-type nitrate/sulfonate/bicarbonate transport system ATPase subunit
MSAGQRLAQEELLQVAHLGFTYHGSRQPALSDVSLSVRAGQVLGVLGPNGSGKTTLMAAILGARRGTRQGVVRYHVGESELPTPFGYCTQEIALYPQLSVRENLAHAAGIQARPAVARQLVDAAIDEFRLASVADHRVHRLSGGWQRLAHVATSFVHRPMVRLLDEPSTALDFETREHLVALVSRWAAEGVATIVTSHYHLTGATGGVELANRLADAHPSDEDTGRLRQLAVDVSEDRASLIDVMERLDVTVDQIKIALGWISEKLARLKLNGYLLRRSPLSTVIELEGMRLRVEGKAAGWRTLRTVAEHDERLGTGEFDRLIERAAAQAEMLESLRVAAVQRVLVTH